MTPEAALKYAQSKEGLCAARDFLSAALRMDAMIALKHARLDDLREKRERISRIIASALPSAGTGDRVGETAAEIADLENEVLRDYSALVARQKQIGDAIRRVPDPRQSGILEMRYLRGLPFFRIAMDMHYDERQIYRLHKKALEYVALRIALGEIDAAFPLNP